MSWAQQQVFGSGGEADGEEEEEEEERLFLWALQLGSASVLTMALRAAIELGLFDLMAAAGPAALLSPSDIASRLHLQPPAAATRLGRVMHLLACYSVLTCSSRDLPDGRVERLYGIGAVGKLFLNNGNGVSFAPRSLFSTENTFTKSCCHLKDAVIEGGVPFEKEHGMTMFEYGAKDQRFNQNFNKVMRDKSMVAMKEVLKVYKGFQGLNSLVDVGGGTGVSINMIVSNYPHIKAINFDLPHVVADAPPYPGVEHVGGDMFVSIPKADAIFMQSIIHDWDDEDCLRFLKNCYNALPEKGKVIVVGFIVPEVAVNSLAMKTIVFADILMLVQTPNGKERTQKEYEALANASGFQAFQVVSSALDYHVMEFLKDTI